MSATAVVWGIITVLQLVVADVVTRNLATFIASAVLVPIAWGLSKLLSIPFSDPSPLASLGFLMSLNQLAYIPIAMWAYAEAPRRFLMVLGVITFAHLLPLGWLYRTRIYTVLTVVGVAALFVLGLTVHPVAVAATAMALLLAGAVALFTTTNRHALHAATDCEAGVS